MYIMNKYFYKVWGATVAFICNFVTEKYFLEAADKMLRLRQLQLDSNHCHCIYDNITCIGLWLKCKFVLFFWLHISNILINHVEYWQILHSRSSISFRSWFGKCSFFFVEIKQVLVQLIFYVLNYSWSC